MLQKLQHPKQMPALQERQGSFMKKLRAQKMQIELVPKPQPQVRQRETLQAMPLQMGVQNCATQT
jgi:hypothetical protein